MLSLHLQNVSFSYSDRASLFAGATIHLTAGWTGLVGAGKTTLLRLLAGKLEPCGGQLRSEPPATHIELCTQRVEHLGAPLYAFAESWDGSAQRLRGRLRLDPFDLERWPTLSPGERKRWQIGAALWSEPEILLLDEPTNHLDSGARGLLSAALGTFRGVGLLVSHDRGLLDELTAATLRLDGVVARRLLRRLRPVAGRGAGGPATPTTAAGAKSASSSAGWRTSGGSSRPRAPASATAAA